MATKLTPNRFLQTYGNAVIEATQGTGIFPSVKLAQMAIESGWGAKSLGNNAFGIKANPSWKGKVISFTTQEVINGKRQTFVGTGKTYASRTKAIEDKAPKQTLFREYASVTDSIKDHTKFLIENGIYANALKAETTEKQTQALENAGYASSREYNESLDSIIEKYLFKNLDKKKAHEKN